MLLISSTINAIGVNIFIEPVDLYDSGASGTSILISQITSKYHYQSILSTYLFFVRY